MVKLEQEFAGECNLCGNEQKALISNQDRYGFPVRTAMCLNCGLIYVLDRFTSKGYSEFYESGSYRQLISCFKDKEQTVQRIRAAQVNYAAGLLFAMQGCLYPQKDARLLDVGGSTGLVASEFARQYGYKATVLDPAPTEIEASRSLGIEAVVDFIETWETSEKFDFVLLCRTVEHLFDLRKALMKIHYLLKPEGLFYCDIADFIEICRREGPPQATTKIDHVYWLTQETAIPAFRSIGFELVSIHTTLPSDQVGFLLRKSEPSLLRPVPFDWIQTQIRRFREIETDWLQYGRKPIDGRDWLKQNAYKLKKKILRSMPDILTLIPTRGSSKGIPSTTNTPFVSIRETCAEHSRSICG
ncbi:MAG: class I SAM-dependent methyltransferase [Chloroflexota bacterium]